MEASFIYNVDNREIYQLSTPFKGFNNIAIENKNAIIVYGFNIVLNKIDSQLDVDIFSSDSKECLAKLGYTIKEFKFSQVNHENTFNLGILNGYVRYIKKERKVSTWIAILSFIFLGTFCLPLIPLAAINLLFVILVLRNL